MWQVVDLNMYYPCNRRWKMEQAEKRSVFAGVDGDVAARRAPAGYRTRQDATSLVRPRNRERIRAKVVSGQEIQGWNEESDLGSCFKTHGLSPRDFQEPL